MNEPVGERERLRRGGDVDAAEQLVDGLEGLAVARLVADDRQGGGEELEHRHRPLPRARLGADDDEQIALARASRSPGQRCVDELDSEVGKAGGDVDDVIDPDRARHDHDSTGGQRRGDPGRAEEHLPQLLAVADRQQHGIRPDHGARGAGVRRDAGGFGKLESSGGDVEAVDAELAGQARRHGQSHGAESERGDGVGGRR